MPDIKRELADVIRSKPDDELLAMVMARQPATLVTKPVISQGKTSRREPRRKPNNGVSPGDDAELVYKTIDGKSGTTVTEVVFITGLGRSAVRRCIAALKRAERVFQGGERRFARYSTTQAAADRASSMARTAGGQ